jgi:hypothetical protein
MAHMPASPSAHRKESIARLRAIEDGLDKVLVGAGMGGGATRSPAPVPVDPRVIALAHEIGQDRILLPEAITINRAWTEDGEMIATSITFDGLTVTIADALRYGILTPDGRFDHYRAGAIRHCMPRAGELKRPNHLAALPGRPSL